MEIIETKEYKAENFLAIAEVNPICYEYPGMTLEEKARLEKDIFDNERLLQPILAIKKNEKISIIDGRNRFEALQDMGIKAKNIIVPVTFYKETDENKLRRLSDSYNLSRRHLTSPQKAIILFDSHFSNERKKIEKEAKKKQSEKQSKKQEKNGKIVVAEELAKLTGTNRTYVSAWSNVNNFFQDENVKDKNTKETNKLYSELQALAYQDNKNYKKIVSAFIFPHIKSAADKDGKTKNIAFNPATEADKMLELIKILIEKLKVGTKVDIKTLKRKIGLPTGEEKIKEKINNVGIYIGIDTNNSQRIKLGNIIRQALLKSDIDISKLQIVYSKNDSGKKEIYDTITKHSDKYDLVKILNEEQLPND